MPLSGVLKITPRFHGHLKASLEPLSGVIKLTLPIETPVIHVPLSGQVGGTLPYKSYSSLSWADQTANGRLRGQSLRSGFAVIGTFEPMPAGAGTAPPRCHPPPDGGTLIHVNNSLPGLTLSYNVGWSRCRAPACSLISYCCAWPLLWTDVSQEGSMVPVTLSGVCIECLPTSAEVVAARRLAHWYLMVVRGRCYEQMCPKRDPWFQLPYRMCA